MDINIVTRFNQDVENFVSAYNACNDAIDDMRKINGTYKARRNADAKDTENQRDDLKRKMRSEFYSEEERLEAKRQLALLEFHSCPPKDSEREAYRKARERAEQCVHKLSDCRDALTASRTALKKAVEEDELRTLKNDRATYDFVSRQLGSYPLNL